MDFLHFEKQIFENLGSGFVPKEVTSQYLQNRVSTTTKVWVTFKISRSTLAEVEAKG